MSNGLSYLFAKTFKNELFCDLLGTRPLLLGENIVLLPFRTPGSVPILGLANAPIVETKFLELAMSLLDFSPRIPLGTFSILLCTN